MAIEGLTTDAELGTKLADACARLAHGGLSESQLGCGHLERTGDGMFSLEEVECMGACGGAPMIAVGETFFERVSSNEAIGIIDTIKATKNIPEPKRYAQMPELNLE